MELQAQLMRAQVREGKQRRGGGGDGHAVQRYAVYDACLLTHCTHVCKHGRTLTHMHTRTRSRAHTHTGGAQIRAVARKGQGRARCGLEGSTGGGGEVAPLFVDVFCEKLTVFPNSPWKLSLPPSDRTRRSDSDAPVHVRLS